MRTIILIMMLSYSIAGTASSIDVSIECLAKNIYFEARNQSIKGQYAVGLVTINRTRNQKFPKTICEVVWQKKQFSWTWDNKSDKPKNMVAWETALSVATNLLTKKNKDHTYGALFYHAHYVRPDWASVFKKVVTIEDHLFYR